MPTWISVLPPLVAIGCALIFRQVVLALLAGVFLGAVLIEGSPVGLLRAIDTHVPQAIRGGSHPSMLLFTLLLGGTIGILTRSGGGLGLATLATRWANTHLRGQLATWVLGIVVFFDDYANALLVGPTMRPIGDRLRISREKLAFLVDATAAPVASIALVSSWVGVEVGYIADQLSSLGIAGEPYLVFLETLPYRFYPLFMLAFGLIVILSRRDFGPMREAEVRALRDGKVHRDDAAPLASFLDETRLTNVRPRPLLAIVPLTVVVATACVGMYVTGRAAALEAGLPTTLRSIVGKANTVDALLWSASLGGATAFVLAVGSRALSVRDAVDAWTDGLRAVVLACVILVLAWSLSSLCRELDTAGYLIRILGDGIPPELLPAAVFVAAAVVSFATGTSWGTMAILFPLAVPMIHQLAPSDPALLRSVIASILTGSVWGDHCSPISDTTVMSSMAVSCDHVDHVRTQLPYALLVGGVSVVFGDLAVGYGLYSVWVALVVGILVLGGFVFLLGRRH